MADIVLKNKRGEPVTYEGITTVSFDTPEEDVQAVFSEGVAAHDVPIALDFSEGNQKIEAPTGQLVKSAIILKPDTLVPEHIKKGVEVAGVVGTAGETEEIEVELSMADGNQVIGPTNDEVTISKVTIVKPETLVPENIAKDVDIAGVVGTMTGGNEPYVEYTLNSTGDIIAAKLYGFTAVPTNMFYNRTALETVDFSESPDITQIGSSAFYQCRRLTTFSIPEGVTSIGVNAFSGCTGLTSVTIPDSVTSIGRSAFYSCSALTSVTIPDSVTSIDDSAFYSCSALESIVIGSGVTKIGKNAFSNTYSGSADTTQVTFKVTSGWWYTSSSTATSGTVIPAVFLENPADANKYLCYNYNSYIWRRT